MPAGKQVQCGKPEKYGLKRGCFAFSESDFNLVRINHLLDEGMHFPGSIVVWLYPELDDRIVNHFRAWRALRQRARLALKSSL